MSDIYLFGEPANDDRANESVTLTFSKFELQAAVVNALREATAVSRGTAPTCAPLSCTK